MRVASLDELKESSGAGRWSSSGGGENDRNKKVNEIVRALVGLVMNEKTLSLPPTASQSCGKTSTSQRAIQNWILKYVDFARSPGSALKVFTSSGRLANHLKIREIGEVGKLVKKIQMKESTVGKVGRSVRLGQGEYTKFEHDAMLAEAGEEGKLIKC